MLPAAVKGRHAPASFWYRSVSTAARARRSVTSSVSNSGRSSGCTRSQKGRTAATRSCGRTCSSSCCKGWKPLQDLQGDYSKLAARICAVGCSATTDSARWLLAIVVDDCSSAHPERLQTHWRTSVARRACLFRCGGPLGFLGLLGALVLAFRLAGRPLLVDAAHAGSYEPAKLSTAGIAAAGSAGSSLLRSCDCALHLPGTTASAAAHECRRKTGCVLPLAWRAELLTGAERQPRYCACPMVWGPPSHCEGGHHALPAPHAGCCSVAGCWPSTRACTQDSKALGRVHSRVGHLCKRHPLPRTKPHAPPHSERARGWQCCEAGQTPAAGQGLTMTWQPKGANKVQCPK